MKINTLHNIRKCQALILFLMLAWCPFICHAQGTFTASPIPDNIWAAMQGKSIPKGARVDRSSLRYLRMSHIGKDGKEHIGEMICNKSIADDLIDIFLELYIARYVIEEMSLIDKYDASDNRSMEANNTSCFNYRLMVGSQTKLSKHGLGLAIDINPLYNPYVRGKQVEPEKGRPYAFNRRMRKDIPMKIDEKDLCYRLFIAHGFKWGGAWKSCQDYQHFER